jgi:hypothetical protein
LPVVAGLVSTIVVRKLLNPRVLIDDRRVMDEWTDNSGPRTLTTYVPAGNHHVTIELRNGTGPVNLGVAISP